VVRLIAGTRLDTASEVDVESPRIDSLIVPAEPATPELASGVKVAVSCSGEASAENETRHVAVGRDEETGSSEHEPPIGTPKIANVSDPDMGAGLVPADTVATSVTTWLVTGEAGEAPSDVVLAPAVWLSCAWPLTPALVSVAVTVTGPGVVVLWISAA
jgi:hypothetical protein